MTRVTIGNYLLTRLTELGIKDIFGVPGDYNLAFLDQIINFKSIRWVGNCNELNAAYAADGYARINGAAAIVTTFGVGELSAINGIAGSYAEYLPVVNIVGAPATTVQKQGAIMHHTFGTGEFGIFIDMFQKISAAVVILDSPEQAGKQIDEALEICWLKKQPVYVSLPTNMVNVEIEAPKTPLHLAYPVSHPHALAELISRAETLIRHAKSPVILIDFCVARHHMQGMIDELLAQTGIPFAAMNMGKGIINESQEHFIGLYGGNHSTSGVQERVEQADCLISFGPVLSDFNSGGFTCNLNVDTTIAIHSNYVKIHHSVYPDVYFNAVIPALTRALTGYQYKKDIIAPRRMSTYHPSDEIITQKRFWMAMADFLKENDIILAEIGTSLFGLLEIPLPDRTTFISQSLWGAIGYTVGALLGAAVAAPARRAVLFVGDGSFQLTAQEISTVIRNGLTPIVFLINNEGYTIERVIHGPDMIYNDIQSWKYAELPKIFSNHVFTAKVSTENELANAIIQLKSHRDKMSFIEVMMNRKDCPENLHSLVKALNNNKKL
ncbi:alpha-keto acid decarboxylase family protein [Legionella oakridgensis]|nr:alpha-keto acid decarboxylase family protein [Legionella oakridgensis]KTD44037.1 pyruvate decarboxylase [Legionella oakridgensis]STY19580.1 pyruvate decarboxylase [Legionella longbeachae]